MFHEGNIRGTASASEESIWTGYSMNPGVEVGARNNDRGTGLGRGRGSVQLEESQLKGAGEKLERKAGPRHADWAGAVPRCEQST